MRKSGHTTRRGTPRKGAQKKATASRARTGPNDVRESGLPGGGAGRRDEVGRSGVYPMSGGIPRGKHLELRTPAAWGQGDRGAAGYDDSGGSELVYRDGQLLGGLTAGPGGEPTIDIHGGDSRPTPEDTTQLRRRGGTHRKNTKHKGK